MRYWQVEVVTYDYEDVGAGKATLIMNVEAETGPEALATSMDRLGPIAYGTKISVTEQAKASAR